MPTFSQPTVRASPGSGRGNVLGGQPGRRPAAVDGDNGGEMPFVGERQRQASGAGAEVEGAPGPAAGEGKFDHTFGFGPGDQGAAVAANLEPTEAGMAQHVGQRLSPNPPVDRELELPGPACPGGGLG